jgi:hypothetical protein
MKASELDKKFDAGEDITEFLDASKARSIIANIFFSSISRRFILLVSIMHQ